MDNNFFPWLKKSASVGVYFILIWSYFKFPGYWPDTFESFLIILLAYNVALGFCYEIKAWLRYFLTLIVVGGTFFLSVKLSDWHVHFTGDAYGILTAIVFGAFFSLLVWELVFRFLNRKPKQAES